jgi:hypothetical protein
MPDPLDGWTLYLESSSIAVTPMVRVLPGRPALIEGRGHDRGLFYVHWRRYRVTWAGVRSHYRVYANILLVAVAMLPYYMVEQSLGIYK